MPNGDQTTRRPARTAWAKTAESQQSKTRAQLRPALGLTLNATGKLRLAYRHLIFFRFGSAPNRVEH